MFLRTKLDETLVVYRSFTDFPPTLHRLWYGGSTEEEGKNNVGTTAEKSFTFSRLQEKVEVFL